MANIAHISSDGRIQTNVEHLKNVSTHCGLNAEKIQLKACGQLSGLLHDMGKFQQSFFDYICNAHADPAQTRKGPDHAAIGAIYLQELAQKYNNSLSHLTAQIISIAVMWHHGGLRDIRDVTGDSKYLDRLCKYNALGDVTSDDGATKKNEAYCETVREFHENFSACEVERLFEEAVMEITAIFKKVSEIMTSESERLFCFGLICKYLYSCLIDADRYDTMMFEDGIISELPENDLKVWDTLLERFENKYARLTEDNNKRVKEIDILRKYLSDNCRKNAYMSAGVYTLNCPTGSGKTLSSLRYALHHARHTSKDRVFYVIPLISIIEQNSKVIKDFLDEEELILELHSAVESDINNSEWDNDLDIDLKAYELLSERMDAPIVITTMVRFLNTFFKGSSRNMRAIHSFANSLIVFDEIQTIPIKCIGMFNTLINFLVYICNATVVFSTATQIILDRQHGDERPIIGVSQHEISECTKEIREKFIRVDFDTSLLYKITQSGKKLKPPNTLNEITEEIKIETARSCSILCIFNTKKTTELVYDAIVDMQSAGELSKAINVYFLTTGLCPAHRFERIKQIKSDLKQQRPIVVISTQLIESGVDVSFDTVFRSLAGLDSLIQSAGRCNREGEKEGRGRVVLLNPEPKIENLEHLSSISVGKAATLKLLHDFNSNPDKYENRYDSQGAIKTYFLNYLEGESQNLKYPFKMEVYNTKLYMYDILAKNGCKANDIRTILNQAFETAGKNFEPIDTIGIPVVVPYGEGENIIAALYSSEKFEDKRDFLRKLQKYTINIACSHEKEIAEFVEFYEEAGIYILADGYYNDIKGFTKERHLNTKII